MDLIQLRAQIDQIDNELVHLFVRRMDICSQVAAYKKQHELPILMSSREQEKLSDIAEKAGPELADYARQLYTLMFELSRDYQTKQTEVV